VVSGLARRDGIRFRHCLPFARVSRMVVGGMSVVIFVDFYLNSISTSVEVEGV
jgi:hypothetical protein